MLTAQRSRRWRRWDRASPIAPKPTTPIIGSSADISGTGTATLPMLSIFVPAKSPEFLVASAANSPFFGKLVLETAENIPSDCGPIWVVAVYVQVRLNRCGLSIGVTLPGVFPTSAAVNVQPAGWVLPPATYPAKS